MSLLDYLQCKPIPQDRPVLIEAEEGRVTSYGTLWDKVDRLAVGLCGLGLQPQDRVALALPNSRTWIISFLAVLKAGGIVVPLRQSATSSELKRLIKHCQPSLFIGDSSFINRSLPFDLVNDEAEVVICFRRLLSRFAVQRIIRLEEIAKRTNRTPPIRFPKIPESQVASINYTYRGYGYPLGAMLTHKNYLHGIKGYIHTVGLEEGQRHLLVLPLSHIYSMMGSLLAPLASGGIVIVVRNSAVQRIGDTLSQFRPNVLTGVPALYWSLLRSCPTLNKLTKIQEAICGGSLMPLSLYTEAQRRWRVSLRQGYGLTECLPVVINPSSTNRPDSLGKPGLGVTVKIFGDDDREKSANEIGEIAVRGPTVMVGYFDMPKETSEVLRNGWCYTGDSGWLDSDGYLHFAGVKKRIAKVGGNTVDLAEVENELLNYPGISYARVEVIPDGKLGETIRADVKTLWASEQAVRRFLRHRLASYKIPKICITTTE